jgi:hypothetical protein
VEGATVTDIVDRMRTCAAAIVAVSPSEGWTALVTHDAANLLIEASNLLVEKQPEPEAESLADQLALEPFVFPPAPEPSAPAATWIDARDTLPGTGRVGTKSPKACPQCDSRAAKRVYRDGQRLMLACPVCGNAWAWRGSAT